MCEQQWQTGTASTTGNMGIGGAAVGWVRCDCSFVLDMCYVCPKPIKPAAVFQLSPTFCQLHAVPTPNTGLCVTCCLHTVVRVIVASHHPSLLHLVRT
jgi:hypothetical protein